MLKTSWTLDRVISPWSFSSQLLTNITCFWKQKYSHFPSLIPVVHPSCAFVSNGRAGSLCRFVFDSSVHFCFVLVLCFIFSAVCCLWAMGACQFELWFLWLLSVFSYLQQCLANCRVLFWKAPSTEVIFFITYCFELTIPNQAVFLT